MELTRRLPTGSRAVILLTGDVRPEVSVPRLIVRRILAILSLSVACSDPAAPDLRPGSYTLASVDGVSPPVLRWATIECDYTVSGATLTIGPADSASLVVEEVYDCTRAGGPVTIGGRTYLGTFTVTGGTFSLVSPPLSGPPVRLMGAIVEDGGAVDIDDLVPYAAGPGILRLRR